MYSINDKTDDPIGTKFSVGPQMTPGKVMEHQTWGKNSWKIHRNFYVNPPNQEEKSAKII